MSTTHDELRQVLEAVQQQFKLHGNNFPDGFDWRVFRWVDDAVAQAASPRAEAAHPAAVKEAEPNRWHTMESAPTDGTEILLVTAGGFMHLASWDGEGSHPYVPNKWTHWQIVTTPRASTDEAAGAPQHYEQQPDGTVTAVDPVNASQGEREAYVRFLTETYPDNYTREEAERWWHFEHISAITWKAGRAALSSTPATVPQGYALVLLTQLADWKQSINTLAALSAKADRREVCIRLKQEIADVIADPQNLTEESPPGAAPNPPQAVGAPMGKIRWALVGVGMALSRLRTEKRREGDPAIGNLEAVEFTLREALAATPNPPTATVQADREDTPPTIIAPHPELQHALFCYATGTDGASAVLLRGWDALVARVEEEVACGPDTIWREILADLDEWQDDGWGVPHKYTCNFEDGYMSIYTVSEARASAAPGDSK